MFLLKTTGWPELAGVFHLCQGETVIPPLLGFLFGGSILLLVGIGNILG